MTENASQGPDSGEQGPEQGPEQGTGGPHPSPGSEGTVPPGAPPSSPGPAETGLANAGRRGRKRVAVIASLAGLAGLVLVIVVLAAGAAFGVVPGFIWSPLTGAGQPEHSAGYYPPDTLAYGWLTLAPGGGQFDDSKDIWERFNEIPEFEELYDRLVEEFEEEVDIDFDDLKDWAGPDISVAIVSEDRGEQPLFALTIGVRDERDAEDFMDDWLDYLDREEGADFESDSYEGFDIWADESKDLAFGLSGDLLVFASAEDFLEEVIDGINGDLKETLADDESFQAARAALPEKRFASIYVNLEALWRDDALGLGLDEETPSNLIPEWVAASSAWGDRAISVEMVMPSVLEHTLEIPGLESPAGALPEDTLFLVSAAFDPNLDNWRETLSEYRISEVLGDYAVEELNGSIESMEYQFDASGLPTANSRAGFDFLVDLAVTVVDEVTGVDLEGDLLDHLEGDVSFAAWDFAIDEYGDLAEGDPLSFVALLSYKGSGEDILADSIEELQEFLEDQGGVSFESVDVGADRDAQILGIDVGYSPGYVLNDGYLIFGSTEDSLHETVELQGGGNDNLDSNPEYQRAVKHLPGDKHFLAYVNLNEIIREADPEAFESGIDLYPFDVDAGEVDGPELWEASIGAATASYTLGNQDEDELDRYTAVLTLFPE